MEGVESRKSRYDLEERTARFAERVRGYVKELPRSVSNAEYGRQLIRSSGSVAANYIEANESLSRKDFMLRVKIARKEAKESRLWLRLTESEKGCDEERLLLMNEATELMKIMGAIIEKVKNAII